MVIIAPASLVIRGVAQWAACRAAREQKRIRNRERPRSPSPACPCSRRGSRWRVAPPLARSSSAASLGIDGVESGATELAVATTIPVLSTGMRSVRLGNRELVVSQTFGSIAFLSALFPLANLLTGEAVLPSPDGSNI